MDHKAEQIGRIQGSLLIHCSTAYTSITEVIKHFPCLHHPFSMPLKTYNDVSTKRIGLSIHYYGNRNGNKYSFECHKNYWNLCDAAKHHHGVFHRMIEFTDRLC